MSLSMTDAVLTTASGARATAAAAQAASAQAAAGSATAMSGGEAAKRAAIDATSKRFEASFLSTMLGQMFEGTEVSAPFGGGEGESAFRSFLTDAMGKSMTQHGGIGLSKVIAHEMLKMQGLS